MNFKTITMALAFAAMTVSELNAQVIVLDNFNSGSATGSVISGSSWVGAGKVVQNATSITVGAGAKDDQGWGATGQVIDATGMNFLTIVAKRDAGNNTADLNVLLYDEVSLETKIFSVHTSVFSDTSLTTYDIPLSSWGTLDPSHITDWSIGGGLTGVQAFAMTIDNIQFQATASAVPEPSTYAAIMGFAVMGMAFIRRKKRSV